MSDSLQPHELEHTRLPCPSLAPRVCSNWCPLSQWCHPIISSSATPFFYCLQSCPASGSFTISWLFTSHGQSTGASASASVLPMNIQDWFPLGLIGFISLRSNGLSRIFFSTTVWNVLQQEKFHETVPTLSPHGLWYILLFFICLKNAGQESAPWPAAHFVNKVWLEHSQSYLFMAAFKLQWQSQEVVTEVIWPAEPKVSLHFGSRRQSFLTPCSELVS